MKDFADSISLLEDWNTTIIPIQVVNGKQEQSRCSRYRLDVCQKPLCSGLHSWQGRQPHRLEQEGCVDGWSYSKDIYQSTVVSEFDLVCSDEWKQPFTATVYFIGVLFGSFFSGQLSDRFGRKPVLFATMAVQTLFSFIQVFSTSWTMFTILLFFNGLGQMSNFVAALVLGAEILTGNVRVLYSSLGSCLGFAIGYMILPLAAHFLRDWKSLMLFSSLPGLLYLPLWKFIPESPRWLLSQGKVEEAEAIVRKAAKWNKVKVPNIIFEDYSGDEKNTQPIEKANVLDLLRKSSMRTTTLIFCFVFFCSTTGYFGLSLNTAQLHANPYISCFISAAVEQCRFTSYYWCLKVYPISVLHWRCSAICFYHYFLPDVHILDRALPNSAKEHSNRDVHDCLQSGIKYSTFVIRLNTYILYLPYIILSTLAVVAAIATYSFLPESFGKPLPETMTQIHKRERFIKRPCTGKETTIRLVHLESPL
ncbi:hypothetical protein KUCAC02_003072 [Chaenocephalus aceratus]|uniref:Uncharacterized protein n=1 Tax=Chaenocephalus aceratus TaxID=36190 RepID=A0ACB9WKL9_CHAAC|nr:hypothetical protein KUCAC02_003072 [Chaenocephalus aceratus]